MRPRLNLVTLGVKDLDRSVRFYTGLGFRKSSASQGDVAFFQLGPMAISLYPTSKLAEDAAVPAKRSGFDNVTLAHNAKSEKEVDDVMREAEKEGAKVVKKPRKTFWGGYSGYFADPDGHLWEVAHNPSWKFDDNDNVILP
jgi:catechol 2,3-dioxygenase-like lactoylglutathione lyase family enzyme